MTPPRRRRLEVGELIDDQRSRIVGIERQLAVVLPVCLDAEQRARRQATAHSGDVVTGAQMVEPAVVRVLDEQPERQGLMVDPGRGGERRARIELVRQPQPRRPHALPVEREVIEAAAERRDQTRAEGLIHRNEGTRLVRSQRLVQVESFVDGVDAGQLRSVEDAGAAERTSGRRAPREGGPGARPIVPSAAQYYLFLAGLVVEQQRPSHPSRRSIRDAHPVGAPRVGE